MPAGRLNLTAKRGATFSAVLTWRDEAGALVTTATAKMDVRAGQSETATLLLALTVDNGRIALGGPTGTITLSVAAAAISALAAQTGWYDLFVNDECLFEGVFVIEDRVTA